MTDDTAAINAIALSHGQARWVLWHLGMRVGDDDAKFDSWLKYVRRMGVPFWPDELGHGTGINVIYRYHHLMELAVALALRAVARRSGWEGGDNLDESWCRGVEDDCRVDCRAQASAGRLIAAARQLSAVFGVARVGGRPGPRLRSRATRRR